MNELQIFSNSEFGEIRTVEIEGNPYFVGIDIARTLGYSNPNDAVTRHCRGCVKHAVPTTSGSQQMNIIPEPDLYRLITNSKLPSAEKFERWVFEEVLPTIRRHGAYMTPQKIQEALLNPDTLIQLATTLKEEQNKNNLLSLENAKKDQIIGELKPKADYTDRILKNTGLVSITQIAKDYGMSGQAMNGLLHELGIQYKQGSQWLLYAKYHDKGYTHSKTIDIKRSDGTPDVKMNTKWTQKGRLFLYNKLKEKDVLPVIEQDDPKNIA